MHTPDSSTPMKAGSTRDNYPLKQDGWVRGVVPEQLCHFPGSIFMDLPQVVTSSLFYRT